LGSLAKCLQKQQSEAEWVRAARNTLSVHTVEQKKKKKERKSAHPFWSKVREDLVGQSARNLH
jgi:ATP adenylyltransferase/5',5'''-P-1,P-4-tetraphosphate phosphorylase II